MDQSISSPYMTVKSETYDHHLYFVSEKNELQKIK